MSRPPSPAQADPFGSALTDISQVALPLGPDPALHNLPPPSTVSQPATPLHSAPPSRVPSPGLELDTPKLLPPFSSTPNKTAAQPLPAVTPPVQLDKPACLTVLDEEGYNYYDWLRVQTGYMKYLGVYDIAKGTLPRPSEPHLLADWIRRDHLATAQLIKNIPATLYGQLNDASSASLMRDLELRFAPQLEMRYALTNKRLRDKRIGQHEKMASHIADLRKLKANFISSGGSLSTSEWRMIIIMSLAHSWSSYKAQFVTVNDPDTIINILLLEDLRLADERGPPPSSGQDIALKSSSPTKGGRFSSHRPVCDHCGCVGHIKARCFYPGGGKHGQAPSDWVPRQVILDKLKKSSASSSAQLASTSSPVDQSAESATVARHYAFTAGLALSTPKPAIFIIDSGATSHMVSDSSSLSDYRCFETSQPVYTATHGESIPAIGIGNLKVKFDFNGVPTYVTLMNTLHVPDLGDNLVSFTRLLDAGVRFTVDPHRWTLLRDGIPFGQCIRRHNLFHVDLTIDDHRAYITTTASESKKPLDHWHRRLGHVSHSRIRESIDNEAVTGAILSNKFQPAVCESCIFGKQTATPSPSGPMRASSNFEVLHTDIQYFIVESFSNAKYALIFVDEYSKFTWFYAIPEKSGSAVLDLFKTLDVSIETQFSKRIQALHSDNGGEYLNNAMTSYLESRGIAQHFIAPYRHEMNGLAERANRTIADAVRAMLSDARLPPIYWALAASYFVEIWNRLSHSGNPTGTTPFQQLYGRQPDISIFRIFGCVAYARIPPDLRKKLDPKSKKGIFVGIYHDTAYKILIDDNDLIRSKDVVFDELSFPSTHTQEPNLTVTERRPQRTVRPTERLVESRQQETDLQHLDDPQRSALATLLRKIVQGHSIPLSMDEALSGPDAEHWHSAGVYELGMLISHDVWVEVPRPLGVHIIRGKWVFNIKEDSDTSLTY